MGAQTSFDLAQRQYDLQTPSERVNHDAEYAETLRISIDQSLGKLVQIVDELSKLDGGDYAERPTVDEFLAFLRGGAK